MKNKNLLNENDSDQRVIFKKSHIRDEFFSELKQEFLSWKDLGKHFKVYKSRMENFRNGSISMPYTQFISFLEYVDKEKYTKNIMLKDKNWGRSKGGKTTYEKHKEMFVEGRKKVWTRLENKVDINISLTPEICEFIGAFIGDGFMNQYESQYIIQITGDSRLDRKYYEKILIPIIKELSPKSKPSIKQIQNTLRLSVYSKGIYRLFRERFKMKNGKKTYVITIPEEIIYSRDYKLINPCLRGIFDTDGCVAFDDRKAYKKPYVRIVLHMKSKELMKQIYRLLTVQNIKTTITKNLEYIQINGVIECKKFIDKIGFSNPRHLNKIRNL